MNISTVFVTVYLEDTVGIVGTFMGVVGTAEREILDDTFIAATGCVVIRARGISGTVIVGVVDTLSSVFTTFAGMTVMLEGGTTPVDGLDVTESFDDASAAALRASILSVFQADVHKITKTRLQPQYSSTQQEGMKV